MLKKILLLIFLVCVTSSLSAQLNQARKRALRIENLNGWPQVTAQSNISNDGRFVYYVVQDEIPGKQTLHVCNTDKTWEKVIIGASRIQFSSSSKFLIGLDSLKNVFVLELGVNYIDTIPDVKDFECFTKEDNDFILYLDTHKVLTLKSLISCRATKFIEVNDYLLSPDKRKLVLVNNFRTGNIDSTKLTSVILKSGEQDVLKFPGKIKNILYEKESDRIAFFSSSADSIYNKSIWVYKPTKHLLERVVSPENISSWDEYNLLGIDSFDSDYLIFQMSKIKSPPSSGVDIYSYLDTVPMTSQLAESKSGYKTVQIVFGLKKRKIEIAGESFTRIGKNIGIVVTSNQANRLGSNVVELFNLGTAQRTVLPFDMPYYRNSLTQDGKKIIVTLKNNKASDLYSYELSSGSVINLTKKIPPSKNEHFWRFRKFKLLGYIKGTNYILISDSFDIWKIDLTGNDPLINITNYFGDKNNITFGLAELNYEKNSITIDPSKHKNILLVSANHITKDNDIYSVNLASKASDPVRLTNGHYLYEIGGLDYFHYGPPTNIKLTNGVYFFARESAKKSPNYFITKNFTKMIQISYTTPEEKYNWLNSELVDFKDLKGSDTKGILYKPENFDPAKKYPIIFLVYDFISFQLNKYIVPELSKATINIPFYVSNDYLVFCPDIPISTRADGYESAFNSVVGAANYFQSKPYIDPTRMGLNGHSHGGGETNYIITHTNIFAAAAEGAGASDPISRYGVPTQRSRGPRFDGQERVSADLFNNIDQFVKNSAKLSADKLSTPLLMMHNELDGAVEFSQGLSFFNTLWRLGKRAWLLQYDLEDHNLSDPKNQLDFTIRMKQFFDHYLMDKPAPMWMTRGIRAEEKGINNGFDFDRNLKTPPERQINNYGTYYQY